MSEGPGVLNLAGADTREVSYDAIPSGNYDARIERASWETIKGEDGKLPKGTPMLSVAFVVINHPEYENRWVWNRFIVPPADYDADKSAKMKGALVNLIVAATGHSHEDVASGEYTLDLDDLIDKEVSVNVGRRKWNDEWQNTIRAVRPIGQVAPSSDSSGSGLL